MPVTVFRGDTGRGEDRKDVLRGPRHPLAKSGDDRFAAFPYSGQVFPRIGRIEIDPVALHLLLELFRPEGVGDRGKRGFQVEPPSLAQYGHHAVRQPVQQALGGFGQGIEHPVHALGDQSLPVQVHLVGGKLADLPGKGPEGLLEEAVDGTDGKGRVIVEDGIQVRCRPLLQRFGRGEQGRHEFPVVRGFFRMGRKAVQLLEDTAFHLVRRLVREGDGQDGAVGQPLPARE